MKGGVIGILATSTLTFAMLWPGPASSADESPSFAAPVSLPRLQEYALENNPEIDAAGQRWRAAQTRPTQEGSLPDPMVNAAYHNESFDRLTQGSSEFAWLRFGVEQELPFPGKLSLKEEIAAREADREGALYRATVLDVTTRLRLAYSDYFLAFKSLEIVGKSKALLEQLEQTAEARYGVGDGLQQDVLRAQVELSTLAGRLTSLEQARQSRTAELNAVLNRPPFEPLGAPAGLEKPSLPYSLDQLETLARERSPSLEAAQHVVARAESTLDLAKRQYYPDFVLRADYYNKAALLPEWEVGAGIRLPLYFWRKQAPAVQEAVAGVSEARASRQSAAQETLAKIKDFHAQASSAERLVEIYGDAVVPQAELSLSSALAGYKVGKVDFLTVLNSFTILNEYQLRYYEERANLEKAVAQLEHAAGLLPSASSEGKPK